MNLKLGKKEIFIIAIVLFSILRIYIGQFLPNWFFVVSPQDDMLLINYANLTQHFTDWNVMTLTKNMGYPLFLYLVNISGISYKFWISIIWIVSGLLMMFGIKKFVCKNKIVLLLSYLFIIFMPVAFDTWCGTRIYRNSILAPFSILFLTSLFIFVNSAIAKDENRKSIIIWAIISGILFAFNFYIKEDGIITLPIFLASIGGVLAYKVYTNIKNHSSTSNIIKIAIICIIPLLIFGASTICYKEINNHYFGVAEINTRTEGELGEFWHILLKIDDPEKTTELWVGVSTIQQAFDASPTLHSRPDIINNWTHTGWAGGDLQNHPLLGDRVAWSLRDTIHQVGLFDNETEASEFFTQVNNELEEALQNGTLNESKKIFITSSANGKTFDEIKGLKLLVIESIKATALFSQIRIAENPLPESSQVISNNVTDYVENMLNDDLINVNETTGDYLTEKLPAQLVKVDIGIYEIVSYLVVALSGIGFIWLLIHQIRNKFKSRHLTALVLFEIMVLGTYFVQIFGLSWFCSWLDLNTLYFYLAPSYGLIAVFELLSIAGGFYLLKESDFIKKYPKINKFF